MENRPTYRELWDRVQSADDRACDGGFQDSDCRFCKEVSRFCEEATPSAQHATTSMQSAIHAISGPKMESGWDLLGLHHPSSRKGLEPSEAGYLRGRQIRLDPAPIRRDGGTVRYIGATHCPSSAG